MRVVSIFSSNSQQESEITNENIFRSSLVMMNSPQKSKPSSLFFFPLAQLWGETGQKACSHFQTAFKLWPFRTGVNTFAFKRCTTITLSILVSLAFLPVYKKIKLKLPEYLYSSILDQICDQINIFYNNWCICFTSAFVSLFYKLVCKLKTHF